MPALHATRGLATGFPNILAFSMAVTYKDRLFAQAMRYCNPRIFKKNWPEALALVKSGIDVTAPVRQYSDR